MKNGFAQDDNFRGRKPNLALSAGRIVCVQKEKRAANFRSLLLEIGLYPPPDTSPRSNRNYWLSGLKATMPASVAEHLPAGSTRTTASSSAQNARIPVWLMVIGTARAV